MLPILNENIGETHETYSAEIRHIQIQMECVTKSNIFAFGIPSIKVM